MTEVGNFKPSSSFLQCKSTHNIEELLYIYNTFNNNYRSGRIYYDWVNPISFAFCLRSIINGSRSLGT